MQFKRAIPHLITIGNLLCGTMAIYTLLVSQDYILSSYYILAGALLDFADGMVARLLGVAGELGKQLDSLADMVSFGLAPAVFAFSLFPEASYWAVFVLLIPALSALRLAIFNISTNQSDTFIGIPTPMNTLFWIGLVYFVNDFLSIEWIIQYEWVLVLFIVFSSVMLVVNLPMMALKFKRIDKAFVYKLLLFVLPSIVILLFMQIAGLFIVYFLYIIYSVLYKFAQK